MPCAVVRLQFRERIRFGERDLEDLGDVDLHDVVERVLKPRQRHPVAADGDAAAGEFGGVAVLHEARDEGLVAREARVAEAVLEQDLDAAPVEAAVHAVPHADRQVAARLQLRGGFEDDEAHAARLVASVRGRPAELVVVGVVEQQAEAEELGLFVGEEAGGRVARVVGAQQLVELPARAVAVVGARGHVEDGDPLHGLAEGRRLRVDDRAARARNLDEVRAPLAVRLGHRPVGGRLGQAANPRLHAENRRLLRLQQLGGNGIGGERTPRRAHLREEPAPAQLQANPVVRREVRVLADAGRDVVLLLERFEVGVVEREVGAREPVAEAHAREHEHPAAGERVVGVDVERMVCHEPVEVRRPGARAGELPGRVPDGQVGHERLGGQDEAVVVLVARPELRLLLGRLCDLPRRQARHPLRVAHFASSSCMRRMRLKSMRG